MSIEIYVLSDRRLDSIAAWQQALDREGFTLRLDTSRPFEALSGYLPAYRGSEEAGFECDHWTMSDLTEEPPEQRFGRAWRHVLAFRFGGDEFALWAANAAATAYARATDGVVYDSEAGEILSPDKAAALTRHYASHLPES
jgi:hypothetical protein